ncbi:hypothetical protein N0V88_007355 [Collariella sp. IMI 366227]|nr:hypothetical protein N0V88_007355 [Collariella sp. IMI 366227]
MSPPSPDASTSASTACLWDEIESNYYASLRAHRDRENALLYEKLHARSENYRRYLLDNYNAQVELLSQLRALYDQYDACSALLKVAEAEYKTKMEERRRERDAEDVVRKEWGCDGTEERGDGRRREKMDEHARLGLDEARVAGEQGKLDGVEQEQPAEGEKEALGGEALPRKPQEDPPAVEEEMPDVGQLPDGHGVREILALYGGMDGVEASGALKPSAVEHEPNLESLKLGRDASFSAGSSSQEVNDEHTPSPSAPGNELANGDSIAIPGAPQQKPLPSPKLKLPDVAPAEPKPEAEDVTMPNLQPSAKGKDDMMIPAPAPTILPALLSLLTSSELSSRRTIPALDASVSFPYGSRRLAPSPEEAEEPVPGSVEVVDISGDLIDQLQPLEMPRALVDCPKNRPSKRPVAGGFTPVNASRSDTTEPQAETPTTPLNGPFQSVGGPLPEINKEVLCLRHNGVVYTHPPIMRGVPLAKISPNDDYWEKKLWVPMEKIINSKVQKYQERYEQLEQAESTRRRKYRLKQDAKRGRLVLKFLKEGTLHPYQLVAKEWITPRLTHYDTLFRLAQLLEELSKMQLDIEPAEWLRHRINEVHEEKGDKFNLPLWLKRAYHDPKIEQLREKNGFAYLGRRLAKMSKSPETGGGGSNRGATAPQSLKRRDTHAMPEVTTANKRTRVDRAGTELLDCPIGYDGYTSTDSYSGSKLTDEDWHLHQVKTSTAASNVRVTQYWHWVAEDNVYEHQVLGSLKPAKWSVFKDPYNFHLKPVDIQEVMFARGDLRVIVSHKKGAGGEELSPRGDVMAQFKRKRTKRRFLASINQKGVRLREVKSDCMDTMWNSLTPPTLPMDGDVN